MAQVSFLDAWRPASEPACPKCDFTNGQLNETRTNKRYSAVPRIEGWWCDRCQGRIPKSEDSKVKVEHESGVLKWIWDAREKKTYAMFVPREWPGEKVLK